MIQLFSYWHNLSGWLDFWFSFKWSLLKCVNFALQNYFFRSISADLMLKTFLWVFFLSLPIFWWAVRLVSSSTQTASWDYYQHQKAFPLYHHLYRRQMFDLCQPQELPSQILADSPLNCFDRWRPTPQSQPPPAPHFSSSASCLSSGQRACVSSSKEKLLDRPQMSHSTRPQQVVS